MRVVSWFRVIAISRQLFCLDLGIQLPMTSREGYSETKGFSDIVPAVLLAERLRTCAPQLRAESPLP